MEKIILVTVGYLILHIRGGYTHLPPKISTTITLCILLLLAFQGVSITQNRATPDSLAAAAPGIEQIIDYGNSTKYTFTNLSGTTVFDVLNQTANVTFIQFGYGKFVVSINRVINNEEDNGHYWQYWVNSNLAPVAADLYTLSEGDQILWKYTTSEYNQPNVTPYSSDWWIGLIMIVGLAGLLIGVTVFLNQKFR